MLSTIRLASFSTATVSVLVLFLGCTHPIPSAGEEPARGDAPVQELAAGDLRRSGTIHLDVSCAREVEEDFSAAVALLHSFFYVEARRRFLDIANRDPSCAMAWWGVAMTWYHPLWAPPTDAEHARGVVAVNRAKAIGGKSELERGLIVAIDTYFTEPEPEPRPLPETPWPEAVDVSCHGLRSHSERAKAYNAAMGELREKFPDHVEVATLYALSMLGTVDPRDKTYARQRAAGAILEELFRTHGDHPGIAHYIIHAYDYPALAKRALTASRRYDDIAPWVPHALHMPTHIYTRLGMWKDSIEGNVACVEASREYASRFYGGATMMDDLHAMDYLMFAYLQTGRDKDAHSVLEHLLSIRRIAPGNAFASAYAAGAMPARYALERGEWRAASTLQVASPTVVERFPFAAAHIEFARAVGAARCGELAVAERAAARLAELKSALKNPKFRYWVGQIEIQRLAASAWIARAKGEDDTAVTQLRRAAEMEDAAGTSPVTPGQILPAREQLGELLAQLERPADALVEFEASLQSFPGRWRGTLGAARAARAAGSAAVARRHYEALTEMAVGEERADDLREAREFLKQGK